MLVMRATHRTHLGLWTLGLLALTSCGEDASPTLKSDEPLNCLTCPRVPPVCAPNQRRCGEVCIGGSECCTVADCPSVYAGSTSCVDYQCKPICAQGYKFCAGAIPANSCIPDGACCSDCDCNAAAPGECAASSSSNCNQPHCGQPYCVQVYGSGGYCHP
jgi:hypothetical protein